MFNLGNNYYEKAFGTAINEFYESCELKKIDVSNYLRYF